MEFSVEIVKIKNQVILKGLTNLKKKYKFVSLILQKKLDMSAYYFFDMRFTYKLCFPE